MKEMKLLIESAYTFCRLFVSWFNTVVTVFFEPGLVMKDTSISIMEDILRELVKESNQLLAAYLESKREKNQVLDRLEKEEDEVELLKRQKQQLTGELADIVQENHMLKDKLDSKKKELADLKKEVDSTGFEAANLQSALQSGDTSELV